MTDKNFPCRRKDDEDRMKRVMKDAIKEWMDERWATFGKWTATGIAVAALGLLAYAIVAMNQVPWAK